MASIHRMPGRNRPFRVFWRSAGMQHTRGFATLKEAKDFRASVELTPPPSLVHTPPVDAAVKAFIADRTACCSPITAVNYRTVLEQFISLTGLSGKRLGCLTLGVVEAWRNELARTRQPVTVRNYMKYLRVFLAFCLKHGWVKGNPAAVAAMPRVKRHIPRYISQDDAARLIRELAAGGNAEYLIVAVLALRAGMRRDEIRRLRWADVDVGGNVLYVNETKSKEPRIIDMHPDVAAVLRDWPRTDARVFPPIRRKGGRNKERSKAQGKHLNAWLKAHGFNVTVHGLRHSFGYHAGQSGGSEDTLRTILGHSSIQTTRIYSHSRDVDRRAAIERLPSVLPSPATPSGKSETEGTGPAASRESSA